MEMNIKERVAYAAVAIPVKALEHAKSMWTDIHKALQGKGKIISVSGMKIRYCQKHKLGWIRDCVFCEFIPNCHKCPLKTCKDNSLWERVERMDYPLHTRIDAAAQIIGVINTIIDEQGGKK